MKEDNSNDDLNKTIKEIDQKIDGINNEFNKNTSNIESALKSFEEVQGLVLNSVSKEETPGKDDY